MLCAFYRICKGGDTNTSWVEVVIPGVFSAAGLMVPEPSSIMPLPMPFIEEETGCEVEYMITNKFSASRYQVTQDT